MSPKYTDLNEMSCLVFLKFSFSIAIMYNANMMINVRVNEDKQKLIHLLTPFMEADRNL